MNFHIFLELKTNNIACFIISVTAPSHHLPNPWASASWSQWPDNTLKWKLSGTNLNRSKQTWVAEMSFCLEKQRQENTLDSRIDITRTEYPEETCYTVALKQEKAMQHFLDAFLRHFCTILDHKQIFGYFCVKRFRLCNMRITNSL